MTEDAVRARAAAAAARPPFFRGPEDMFVTDRCISYGIPDLFAAYMSVYRIMQSADYVVIAMEKIHDVRIIPLDGRPHVSPRIRHYLGDSRGRRTATRSSSKRRTSIRTATRWAGCSGSPTRT